MDFNRGELGFVDDLNLSSEWSGVDLDLPSVAARSVLHRVVDRRVWVDAGAQSRRDADPEGSGDVL